MEPRMTATVSTPHASAVQRPPLDMAGLSFILFGHAAFQHLNAACELGLFELLSERPGLTKDGVAERLGLADRAVDILLLGTTALGLTECGGGGYRTAGVVADLMAGGDWSRLRDTVAFEHHVTYEGLLDYTESLRANTNVGIRRVPGEGRDLYHRLAENPLMESVFYRYMRSWSELANPELVRHLDLSGATRLLDCGGGDAVNAIALAAAWPGLRVSVLEIEATALIARQRIAEAGLDDRVDVVVADMFAGDLPAGADCVLFAHQLVIWTLEQNTELLRKAHRALPDGGRVIVFNSMSDDDGRGPLVAALDSVYFAALPAEGGMIYTWAQHERCLRDAGFTTVQRIPCDGWTPHGIIVATK
jgi:ubiquinone/menaquinone biosynthesis C-methylase UbiE